MPPRLQTRAVLHVNPGGYGFAQPLDEGERRAVFIPPGYFRGALDGDELEVVYWESEKGLEGRIESIVARKRTRVVGVLSRAGNGRWVLLAEDPRLIWPIRCRGGPGPGEPGKVVVAGIERYPEDPDPELVVRVERTVGEAGALETEVQKILIEHGIDDRFTAAVQAEADAVPREVGEHELVNRADLRGLAFMTIDPPDARDFDDAVCVELLGDSAQNDDYRLHVAVADVSHYVHEGTAVDEEARTRCFSTYLPDRSVPMLPAELSSHMCSLVPREDRLAMVASMRVDAAGVTSEHEVRAAVIHSRRRMTYGEVAEELEAPEGAGEGAPGGPRVGKKTRARLLALRACADRLRARRLRGGAIELDLPEAKVVLEEDDRSRILDVRRSRASKAMARAYNLIEELMIAANEAVGALAVAERLPAVFRVHAQPDDEKLAQLTLAAHELGTTADPEQLRRARGVQKLLSRIHGRSYEPALNMLMLRAMAQAQYATENIGHFALASTAYVHFTSPIRRYPDLISHRVLKAWLRRRGAECGPEPVPRMPRAEDSESQAVRSSAREREISDAERETQRLFAAVHMLDRIGDRFDGRVTGLSQHGVFVQLDQPFVDGMVKVGDLERDYGERFYRDETGVRMVGEDSGRRITVGDRVVVEVVDASVPRRQVDLYLVSTPALS